MVVLYMSLSIMERSFALYGGIMYVRTDPVGLEDDFDVRDVERSFGVRQLAAALAQASLLAGKPDAMPESERRNTASKLAGRKRQQAAALQSCACS